MHNAKAIAQAAKLDDAARQIKRAQNLCRDALHTIRQTQAELNGIEVETIQSPLGGIGDDRNENSRAA